MKSSTQSSRFWKISPGEKAFQWEDWKARGYIAIGWDEFGDLRNFHGKEEIIEAFRKTYPYSKPDQLLDFFYEMKKGDKVLIYGRKSILAIGEIIGDYYYKEEESEEYRYLYYHRRDVKWLRILDPPLEIESLSDELEKKLMRARTIIELSADEWREVEEAISERPPEERMEEREELSLPVAMEKTLQEYLAQNPSIIGPGLKLIKREFPTDVGNIDLLFKDEQGNFVVVETKKGRESDRVIGQILRYIGWMKKNTDSKVRGIIVTHSSDPRLEYAIEAVKPLVELKFYKIKFEITDTTA